MGSPLAEKHIRPRRRPLDPISIDMRCLVIRAYVLIEADQTRVKEIQDALPQIELDGSRVVTVDVVAGPYDLVAMVESTDLAQLGR